MINLSIPQAVSFSLGFLVSLRVFNLLNLYLGIASFINAATLVLLVIRPNGAIWINYATGLGITIYYLNHIICWKIVFAQILIYLR